MSKSIFLFLKNSLKLPINREKSGIRKPVQFSILGHKFVRKTAPSTFRERIAKLKEIQRGWINYFRMANLQTKLKEIDSWLRNRLRYCIWKGWKKPERRRRNLIRVGSTNDHPMRGAEQEWVDGSRPKPDLWDNYHTKRLAKKGCESMLTWYEKVSPQLLLPLRVTGLRTLRLRGTLFPPLCYWCG